MITNFEDLTHELSFEELAMISDVSNIITQFSKSNPIKCRDLVNRIKIHLASNGIDVRFDEVRLRKLINHMRANSILPIIATSKGYFVSYNHDDVCSQIQSLVERANSIEGCAKGLLKFT
jgi:hypothetical protein